MLMIKIENYQEKVKYYLDISLCPSIYRIGFVLHNSPLQNRHPFESIEHRSSDFRPKATELGLFCQINHEYMQINTIFLFFRYRFTQIDTVF
jgi:hypothetical protein